MDPRRLVASVKFRITIVEPERNIHSGDLFQPLCVGEILWKQWFSLAKVQECGLASGFNPPLRREGMIVGLSQKGQKVAAVVSSVMISPPQEGHWKA